MTTIISANDFKTIFSISRCEITINSRHVAETFNKRHNNLLRAIDNLECSQTFNRLNFKPVNYTDQKGEMRKEYQMTRDGFIFLVMGFTGSHAASFKEAYISAFNKLESFYQKSLRKEIRSSIRTQERLEAAQLERVDYMDPYLPKRAESLEENLDRLEQQFSWAPNYSS